MKNFAFILIVLSLGCSKNDSDIVKDPISEISFDVAKTSNFEGDYISRAVNSTFKSKASSWLEGNTYGMNYGADSVVISREIHYEVALENGNNLDFGIWINKVESKNKLILKEEENEYYERDWDYKNFDDEKLYYSNFNDARILINSNVIFYSTPGDDLIVDRILPAEVNGDLKSYIQISFKGSLYGWYDPFGEYGPVYYLTNGIFKGVIE